MNDAPQRSDCLCSVPESENIFLSRVLVHAAKRRVLGGVNGNNQSSSLKLHNSDHPVDLDGKVATKMAKKGKRIVTKYNRKTVATSHLPTQQFNSPTQKRREELSALHISEICST